MIYLALAELAVIASLVWFIGHRTQQEAQTILDLISSQEAERQLLLDRIERPGTVVAPTNSNAQPQPQEPDEIERMRLAYESEMTA